MFQKYNGALVETTSVMGLGGLEKSDPRPADYPTPLGRQLLYTIELHVLRTCPIGRSPLIISKKPYPNRIRSCFKNIMELVMGLEPATC